MISAYNSIMPFFSVVIATYNRAGTLPRALDSLIAQTETDWEAIVVDDGSTDNTFDLVKSYCLKYQRIKYIFQSNRGPGLAKNAGILASSGLFVTFLDSDDEYKPEHLESRKRLLIENPKVGLLHGGYEIVGNPFVPDKFKPGKFIHLDNCVVGGTFVIRKETAVRLGGYSAAEYGDDTEFFGKAAGAGLLIGKTEEKTYIYHRESFDSICNTKQKNTPAP